MPKLVRTAKGEVVDFDAIIIKQQIAEAPMNIEVARRKEFIDSKEQRARGPRKQEVQPVRPQPKPEVKIEAKKPTPKVKASDFELDDAPMTKSGPVEAVPVLPERK